MMLDTTIWTPEQHETARQAFLTYKQRLRPLIRDARLYHVSDRPDGVHWDGLEYWDPAKNLAMIFAFRGSKHKETSHHFRLAGLDASTSYRLHFEDMSSGDRTVTGSEPMGAGLEVHLPQTLSSELVWMEGEGSKK